MDGVQAIDVTPTKFSATNTSCLVISTKLKMQIGHRNEYKADVSALALRQSEILVVSCVLCLVSCAALKKMIQEGERN